VPVETFIVRLWTPSPELADEIPVGELHGSVEHLGSKDSRRFRNGDDLLDILRIALGPRVPDALEEDLEPADGATTAEGGPA
jgi:hypothetical protein